MGIFDDDLPLEDSPEKGQEKAEEGAGPVEGQPAEEEKAQETETPEAEQKTEEQAQELILGKFRSPEDLARSYQELERKLGTRDEEKEQMRQQLAMLQGYLQALPQLVGQQRTPQQPQQPDEDEKLVQDFEQMYPGLTRALEKRLERKFGPQIGETKKAVEETIAPVREFMMQEHFNRQAMQLAAKYQDLRDFAPDMMQVYQEQPMLAALPNGMELAYLAAKARKLQAGAQAAQVATEKQAARLPSAGPRTAKPKNPDEALLERIFGNDEKGMFG